MKNIKFFKKYFESIVNLDFVEKLKKFNEKEILLPFSENYYTKLFHKLAPDLFDESGYFIQSEYEDGFLYKNGKYCREVKSPYLSILNDIDVVYLYRPIYDDALASKLIEKIYSNTKDDVIIVYTMPDDIIYEDDKFDRIFISTSDIVILIKK